MNANASVLVAFVLTSLLVMSASGEYAYPQRIILQVTYAGTLMLDVTGSSYVNYVFGDLSSYCDEVVNMVSLSVKYKLNITLELVLGTSLMNILEVRMLAGSLDVSPECVKEKVNYTLLNFTVSGYDDLPLLPELQNGTITLRELNRVGDVVGIVRLDVDLVHISNTVVKEDISISKYTRYDLYYEPLTNLPLYYVVMSAESLSNGRVIYVSYNVLDSDIELFKNIKRKVFEVEVSGPRGNSTATLILIYLFESRENQTNAALHILFENNTIKVLFEKPSLCFMQLGVLWEGVKSNMPLQVYTVPGGLIYYTPRALECREIQVLIPAEEVTELKEQVDFPEKGLPPRIPLETPGDFLVSVLVIVSIITAIYWLSSKISDRLVEGVK